MDDTIVTLIQNMPDAVRGMPIFNDVCIKVCEQSLKPTFDACTRICAATCTEWWAVQGWDLELQGSDLASSLFLQTINSSFSENKTRIKTVDSIAVYLQAVADFAYRLGISKEVLAAVEGPLKECNRIAGQPFCQI